MTADVYTSYRTERRATASRLLAVFGRRWIVAAAGCAVMALSGGGLAGYLNLSSATAADAPAAEAPPLG